MTPARRDSGAFPAVLEPILALVERADRRRRRIHPVRSGGLLGIEERAHRGPTVKLRDGVTVRRGARLWAIHFDNARLGELGARGWQGRAYAAARADLRSLAARVAGMDARRRPLAVTGITLLAPLVVRAGFEAHERQQTRWVRLEDRYLRSLLGRWAPDGRSRLARGHGSLRSRQVWLSSQALERRYGLSGRGEPGGGLPRGGESGPPP